jgi:uncharacterized coiled-coil protein SlyX
MTRGIHLSVALLFWVTATLAGWAAGADDTAGTQEQLRQLQEQNRALQEQLHQQQAVIDSLSKKVDEIQHAGAEQNRQLVSLESEMKDADASAKPSGFNGSGKLSLGAEGGVGFFTSGSAGQYPNGEFRVDEMRLFLDASVVETVYFYGELNLATRESTDVEFRLGELYIDFDNVSRFWGWDKVLSVRLGRIYVPFGEEYQNRYAIDNPLISHSLSDLWGVDEGIGLYGRVGKFSYAAAVQNGGIPDTADYDKDKSIAGRVAYDPNRWLHLSASAMRTGNLDATGDFLSAMWFGDGFFRSLGGPGTTKFLADLAEGDIEVRLPRGSVKAFGGWFQYDDNDPANNNRRDGYYYSLEAVHDIFEKLYGGVRFSQIFAGSKGMPIVGNGDFGQFFFGPLTKDIWRLSLGLGYKFSRNLVLKTEYSFEQGRLVNGEQRDNENQFAAEVAFRF